MSTRSRIIVKMTDGTIKSIYCHFDGYPEGVGATLKKHYKDQAKIEGLIALGDLSVLDESIEVPKGHTFETPAEGYTIAYGRDRGEKNVKAKTHTSVEAAVNSAPDCWAEYVHVWNGKKWTTKSV